MHAHFVLAHPEPQSFNAHLLRSGAATLTAAGWTVSVSDLYAMGFDPCERAAHYSEPAEIEARLAAIVEAYCGALPQLDQRGTVRFNRKDEWGTDGRIKPDAPVYSPYMRHRQHLELE